MRMIFVNLPVLLALCLATTGCSLEPEKPEQIPPPPGTPDGSNQGKLGDAIRLTGQEVEMRVRVVRVLDPLPVGSSDKTLESGARFVGVEFELENVGDTVYDEAPLGAAGMLSADGAEASPQSVLGGPCKQSFPSNVRVPPAQKRSVCTAFELGAGKQPASFTFGLDSGFGDEVGEWRLK